MDLSGETAIVTGASRGIGRAIVSTLVERGANVALWSRQRDQVAATARVMASKARGQISTRAVDVRRREQVEDGVNEAASRLGPITLLVNNAGTAGPAGTDWESDPDEWWQCVETTVRGSFLCARSVISGMVDQGRGRIVDVASVTGTSAFPVLSATSVAKSALIRHAENLAIATAETGVRVFALHPGTVDTELLASYRAHPQMAAYLDGLPAEMYSPPELAGEIVARIAAGELDALSGCFIDSTGDIDALVSRQHGPRSPDHLKLRLVSQ